MYKAAIQTDTGKVIDLSYENNILFDIDPLSGINVNLTTSQGFQQIGESIEGSGVKGITRTISGKVLSEKVALQMLSTLPIFTSGKLIFNNTRYCDMYISKTPMFSKKDNVTRFSMQIFCPDPFWKQKESMLYSMGGLTKLFKFPVNYRTHKFGEKAKAEFINCINTGDVEAPVKFTFTTATEARNFGIINQKSLKEMRFNDTLLAGEIVTLWQEKGRIFATKQTNDKTIDYLGYLADNSDLFKLEVGDNILKVVADYGEDDILASAEYTPAFMGVLA